MAPTPRVERERRRSRRDISSTGTGIVVSPDGMVLTNAHVIEGCKRLFVDGTQAVVQGASDRFDLAVIRVPDRSDRPFASFAPEAAVLNSDVTVLGYPLSGILGGLNVTRGSVSSTTGLSGDTVNMQISAPVQPGNSGGPVVNAAGQVVGVVVSKLNAKRLADETGDIPQNINFAIRGEIAQGFLVSNRVTPTVGAEAARLSPVDLARTASDFTVYIECE